MRIEGLMTTQERKAPKSVTTEAGKVISVAVIEDNRLVREGITALLNHLPDLRVVAGSDSDDTSALASVAPQVVLLDLGLRNGDSLRVAEKVLKDLPGSKVIVM